MLIIIAAVIAAQACVTLAVATTIYEDWPDLYGPYLGQQPAGMNAEIFAPGVVSTDRSEINSVFTPDGEALLLYNLEPGNRHHDHGDAAVEGRWSKPALASFSTDPTDVDPVISHDGQRVFWSSRRPRPGKVERRDNGFDIWFADRKGFLWDDTQYLGPVVNSGTSQVYPSVTRNNTLYFQAIRAEGFGKADIYRSKMLGGAYQSPENLGPVINSANYEGDVFVAPGESYLIVAVSGREDGYGGADLYISFQRPGNEWSPLQNMGASVNSDKRDFCPMLSHDEKYLFFSSKRAGEGDIFWIDAKIIEALNGSGSE